MPTPYEVLGLRADANEKEVKRKYRKLAAVSHPDRGGDAAQYKLIVAAYEELTGRGKPDNSHAELAAYLAQTLNAVVVEATSKGVDVAHVDVLNIVRCSVEASRDALRKELEPIRAQLKAFREIQRRLKSADPIMGELVGANIAELERKLKKGESASAMFKAAESVLKGCEYDYVKGGEARFVFQFK